MLAPLELRADHAASAPDPGGGGAGAGRPDRRRPGVRTRCDRRLPRWRCPTLAARGAWADAEAVGGVFGDIFACSFADHEGLPCRFAEQPLAARETAPPTGRRAEHQPVESCVSTSVVQ